MNSSLVIISLKYEVSIVCKILDGPMGALSEDWQALCISLIMRKGVYSPSKTLTVSFPFDIKMLIYYVSTWYPCQVVYKLSLKGQCHSKFGSGPDSAIDI